MAITKSTETKEVRITDTWNVGVRNDTVIKEDGTEIAPHLRFREKFGLFAGVLMCPDY